MRPNTEMTRIHIMAGLTKHTYHHIGSVVNTVFEEITFAYCTFIMHVYIYL